MKENHLFVVMIHLDANAFGVGEAEAPLTFCVRKPVCAGVNYLT